MTTAEAVKAVREIAGLNQTELARVVGLTPRRISQIEAGIGTFRPKPLLAFCKAFGREMAAVGITPLDLYRVEPLTDDPRPAA